MLSKVDFLDSLNNWCI